jgi:hypothetical protein
MIVTNFWPSGLNLDDTSSPLEILEAAKREWYQQSHGLLTLEIQEAESQTKNRMLIVHARHVQSNRTVTLFSVIHRPGAPYPASIEPRDNMLPDILRRSYYKPSFADFAGSIRSATGGHVTNEWVCDTPSEFRSKLAKVFNLGTIKSEVLSLVSGAGSSSESNDDTIQPENAVDGEPDDVES